MRQTPNEVPRMSPPICSLEAEETTGTNRPTGSYKAFCEGRAPMEVAASSALYANVDERDKTDFTGRLHACRTKAWFVRHEDTGQVRVASKKCHLRWCYPCSEGRQVFITEQVLPWFNSAALPKLLTVTLRHTSSSLSDQVSFVYECFRKLRKRAFFKNRVRGGIWFFQVTQNPKDFTWHPHIHALIDSDYLDHQELKDHWAKITSGSTIIHIKSVYNPERTLKHAARYAARPSDLATIPIQDRLELFDAFHQRKICGTWGTARKISLRPKKPEDADKWRNVGAWTTVIEMYQTDMAAHCILKCWLTNKALSKNVTMNNVEDQIDGQEVRGPPGLKFEQSYLSFY